VEAAVGRGSIAKAGQRSRRVARRTSILMLQQRQPRPCLETHRHQHLAIVLPKWELRSRVNKEHGKDHRSMQCKCNLQQGRTQREPGAYLHFGKGNAKGSAGLQLGMRRCEGPLYPKRRVQPWVGVTVSPSERSGNAPGHLSKLPVYQYRGVIQK
jgi:hypothetical protein